ncbi:hypothetical protein HZS61_005853 [Fusarium oxysporum f. sp. conglutinans]|uniref:Uncharacterized protein n=1 Tax=Fusarium oxysporum f. sp. conglutinans TaxID=100902 RepID=A0A8H6GAN6_FUSOX|nr:hypothetical protein HZS61_005853 [Fusarium oxysporum f. sp. conglutinans]
MSRCHLHPPTQSLPLPSSQRRAKRLNPDANETTPKLPKTPRQPLQPLEQNSIVLPNAGSNSQSDTDAPEEEEEEEEEEEDDDLDEIEIDSGHPPGDEENF